MPCEDSQRRRSPAKPLSRRVAVKSGDFCALTLACTSVQAARSSLRTHPDCTATRLRRGRKHVLRSVLASGLLPQASHAPQSLWCTGISGSAWSAYFVARVYVCIGISLARSTDFFIPEACSEIPESGRQRRVFLAMREARTSTGAEPEWMF